MTHFIRLIILRIFVFETGLDRVLVDPLYSNSLHFYDGIWATNNSHFVHVHGVNLSFYLQSFISNNLIFKHKTPSWYFVLEINKQNDQISHKNYLFIFIYHTT